MCFGQRDLPPCRIRWAKAPPPHFTLSNLGYEAFFLTVMHFISRWNSWWGRYGRRCPMSPSVQMCFVQRDLPPLPHLLCYSPSPPPPPHSPRFTLSNLGYDKMYNCTTQCTYVHSTRSNIYEPMNWLLILDYTVCMQTLAMNITAVSMVLYNRSRYFVSNRS